MNPLIIFGILTILAGFMLIWKEMLKQTMTQEEHCTNPSAGTEQNAKLPATVKSGGVIMIGPVPIIFGSDKKYALAMIVLAIILMLLSILYAITSN